MTDQALHLAYSLPERHIDLDLTLPLAGVTAVIGPNGAGKSTTFDVIAGLIHPHGTTLTIGERTLNSHAHSVPAHQRNIGYVMQRPLLFPHMSVARNITFGLPRPQRRSAPQELLDRFNIAHLADRMPRTLSGGQATRVALARALAPHPHLLLLDEPFTALDASARPALRTLLAGLGTPTLLITHDREDIDIAQHVVVLDGGRVVQVGTRAEVVADPRGYAATLLAGD